MLRQCLVLSITKKGISYALFLFWDKNHLQPYKYKVFIKVFQYILKLVETFLIRNYFYSNAKKYKQDKNNRINFNVITDSLIEKYLTISIKFKIRISQLTATILLKQ